MPVTGPVSPARIELFDASRPEEYGGIEYGGLPVVHAVFNCSPTVLKDILLRSHRSRTNRSAWSMASIWPGPIIACRDDSRSTETTRS